MMVQRYEVEKWGQTELSKYPYGDYVEYGDYLKLEDAVIALLADINRRHPGERFKCPLILKLAEIVGYDTRN